MFSLLLCLLLAVAAQEESKPAERVVVVVERISDRLVYECNGRRLDEKRLLGGIDAELNGTDPGATPIFVLLDDSVPISTVFEMGSLLVGKAGLRHVRYFTFSRKSSVMMEFTPGWDRWKLSFDGRLQEKPW